MKGLKKFGLIIMALYPYIVLGTIILLSELESKCGINTEVASSISGYAFWINIVLFIALAIGAGKGQNPILPQEMSKWVMIIKLAHIPFYVIVFILGVFFGLLAFIPVPFMIFASMGIVIMFFILDYIFLLHSTILGLSAVIMNRKAGNITKPEAIVYSIGLFFFCFDVIVAIVLYTRTKVTDVINAYVNSEEKIHAV